MSKRTEQIESLLQRSIAGVIQRGLDDPRVDALVTVTRVTVSKDMRHATVYVTVLPEEKTAKNLAGLTAASRHIGLALRDRVDLRIIPRLSFRFDERARRELEVLTAIHRANQPAPTPPARQAPASPDAVADADTDAAAAADAELDPEIPPPRDPEESP